MGKFIVILLSSTVWLQAQSVKTEISVDAKNLDDMPRQAVSRLAYDIAYYIENTKWTFDELPSDFLIQATIYLDSYAESGYQKIYTGKAFWGNGDDQKYFDKSWQFAFNEGDAIVRTNGFNSLSSFIDYWTLTLLASDLDTWTEFGGDHLYREAREIARRGTGDQFSQGWKDRLEDIEKLSRDQNYRKMKFAYYEAIDLWDSEQQTEALGSLKNFISNLELSLKRQDTRIFAQNFLNAKYRELGDFLWEVRDLALLNRLIRVDETHNTYYQEVLEDW